LTEVQQIKEPGPVSELGGLTFVSEDFQNVTALRVHKAITANLLRFQARAFNLFFG
jgi:hypothetical protein